MYSAEQFDLFLAYYGNRNAGSENAARTLYERLTASRIDGRPVFRVYFHPVTNPEGVFEETPLIVARTPLFLLVIDKGVPRTPAGQLQQYRDDGMLRNLYEEVRSFHNSNMYKEWGGDNAAKLYLADDFDFKQAEQLHPMFSGKTSLNSPEAVTAWASDFFCRTYPRRRFLAFRSLLIQDRQTFERGDWCREAEQCWRDSGYEPLGRLLLSYYAAQAQRSPSPELRSAGQSVYSALRALPRREPETDKLLARAEIRRSLALF